MRDPPIIPRGPSSKLLKSVLRHSVEDFSLSSSISCTKQPISVKHSAILDNLSHSFFEQQLKKRKPVESAVKRERQKISDSGAVNYGLVLREKICLDSSDCKELPHLRRHYLSYLQK